ncbi:MAG: DUF58 domain-containing protein [Anaerolineae bacterium]|nr:DUF58 domain-containing protein [Anaerolineae bacterium]
MADSIQLFDESTQRKLEQLILRASQVRAGAIKGERRSNKRGTSIEFADYRSYVPGDDLRRVDWNIYARADRPLTKLYEDEEDLAVYLLLDGSASMDWSSEGGDPQHQKFLYARRLFAGLAYISLVTNDRLMMAAINGDQLSSFGPARGRGFGVPMMRYVGGLEARGATDLNSMLKRYALRTSRPGLVVLISDMFSPQGYLDGITAFLSKGCEVAVVHVLSPDEIEPPMAGDLRLIDVETGAGQEVSLDGAMRDLYMRRMTEWRDGIRMDCARRGVHYVFAPTSTPWEKVILYDLRRFGVVK